MRLYEAINTKDMENKIIDMVHPIICQCEIDIIEKLETIGVTNVSTNEILALFSAFLDIHSKALNHSLEENDGRKDSN